MVVTNIQTFSGDVEVTSNISITSNLTVGTNKLFVSESSDSVGISNTNPNAEYQLSIGSNIFANAYADMDNLSNAITVHGRIAANLFVGDGGLLSNIASNVSDIVNQGNTIANVVQFVQNDTYDAGLVTEDGVVVGISNTAPSKEYQLSIGSNIFANAYADMDNLSNAITVHGRITANLFVGDGGLLSNIASNVSDIVNQGNTIANVVQFVQNDTYDAGIVTEDGVVVGISNTAPSKEYQLSIGSNIFANAYADMDNLSNAITVHGRIAANLFVGDGGLLSNIASNVSDIVNQGNTIANVVQFVQNDTYDAGIVTEDGVVVGISNTAPSKEYQLSIGSNIFANAYADMDNLSNAITVHGRIAANLFVGDGGLLSNIASNVSDIVNQGNTIANVVQFVQNDTYDAGIVTEDGVVVGISNTAPSKEYQLSIGSNIFANAYADMDNLSNAITVHGRIAANLFVGDGGLLSNIASNVSDIVNQGNTIANVVQFVQNDTYDAGIVTEDGVVVGISNTAPSKEYQLSIGSNIFANAYADMDNLSNAITVHGRIAANLFVGDGGLLSNIASNVSDIVNQGNTIANVVQFVQNDTYDAGIVTEEGVVVGISNTAPSGTYELSVGSNLFINTTGSNVLTVYGNVNANTLTLGDLRVTASYGLNHVTAQNATTSDTVNFTNATTAFVTTANVEVGGEMKVSGHILPTSDSSYDIGSPEFKIRDLFVSNNSMWVGDRTKIAFENGKMKFKRRKIDKVPKVVRELAIAEVADITDEASVETAAVAYAQQRFPNDGITALADLQLQHWKAYTKSIDDTKEISDIFVDDDEDYEAQSAADAWNEIGSNVYSTHRMTIGSNTEPRATLDIKATDALIVPSGTTDERPTGIEGMFRYNSTTNYFEMYINSGWMSVLPASSPAGIVSISPSSIAYANVTTEDITVTGSSFNSDCFVTLEGFDGTTYNTSNFSLNSDSEITFRIGTLASGQAENRPYRVLLTNESGITTRSAQTLRFDEGPTWSSPASQSTHYFGTIGTNTITLSATDVTGGSSVRYSVVGSLPGGLTLSGDTISGTSTETNGTTSTVTIRATDTVDTFRYTDLEFTIVTQAPLFQFTSHTFDRARNTYYTYRGPTLKQCQDTYSVTWDTNSNYFTVVGIGIQQWTVPATGMYEIDAYGATGNGNFPGKGARIKGTFSLTRGDIIQILVGQIWEFGSSSGSGGGGTFVYKSTTSTLLIAAGGGGGYYHTGGKQYDVCNANIHENGKTGDGTYAGVGGTNGYGGSGSNYGGGGAGWFSDGTDGASNTGGHSFANGGKGGVGTRDGGFGGGGASGSYPNYAGGGGGYSGGGAGDSGVGGGGGSYISPLAIDVLKEVNYSVEFGDGKVNIKLL